MLLNYFNKSKQFRIFIISYYYTLKTSAYRYNGAEEINSTDTKHLPWIQTIRLQCLTSHMAPCVWSRKYIEHRDKSKP